MKKYLIFLSAAAFCLSGAQQTVSAQLSLENSYGSLKASLSEIRADKPALPQIDRDLVETQPQSVWQLPPATQWYWHASNGDLSLAQLETAAAELKSGGVYVPVNKFTAKLIAMHIEKKKNRPTKITFDHVTLSGQPQGVELPISDSPYETITSVTVSYASAQSSDTKWLVWVFFGIDGEMQFYLKTEAEARKFADILASCRKLAGISAVPQSRTGFSVSDLTPAQADVLGKTRIDNALVTRLAADGPGEMAGVVFLDLITEVDGVKVRNAGHFNSIVEAAAPGAVLKLACLERTIVMEGDQKKFVWTPKTVELPIK